LASTCTAWKPYGSENISTRRLTIGVWNEPQTKTKRKMTLEKTKRDGARHDYQMASPAFNERVHLITNRDHWGRYASLMVGCYGVSIERREVAKMLCHCRRIERSNGKAAA
jgi:hypothetical protein